MYTRTFVLFLLFDLYTFIIIFAIMSERAETDICKADCHACMNSRYCIYLTSEATEENPRFFEVLCPLVLLRVI